MRVPGVKVAMASSCARSMLPHDQMTLEMDYQINRCMKELFREGYRRMRVIPVGNGDDYKVLGWPE